MVEHETCCILYIETEFIFFSIMQLTVLLVPKFISTEDISNDYFAPLQV